MLQVVSSISRGRSLNITNLKQRNEIKEMHALPGHMCTNQLSPVRCAVRHPHDLGSHRLVVNLPVAHWHDAGQGSTTSHSSHERQTQPFNDARDTYEWF